MVTVLSNSAQVLRLVKKRGILRAIDLRERAIPRVYLRRLCDAGKLVRTARGIYQLPDAPVTENHSLAEVARAVPDGVICLLSALQLHGLTAALPHEVWVAIDTRAWKPKLEYPKLHIVRANRKALEFGVEIRTIEGLKVRVTNPAKTVADCFRYRSHLGLDVALEALRDYVRQFRGKTEPLMEAAKVMRVANVMRPYLEAIL